MTLGHDSSGIEWRNSHFEPDGTSTCGTARTRSTASSTDAMTGT